MAMVQGLAEYAGTTSGGATALGRVSSSVLRRAEGVVDYLGEHMFVTAAVLLVILWVWHMLTRVKSR